MTGPDGDPGPLDLLRNRGVLTDTIVPTLLFGVAAVVGPLPVAAGLALAWCAVVLIVRLARRQTLVHALSGLGAVVVGVGLAAATGRAEGFFLPGIVGNLGFGVLCLASVPVRRPAVAYTSAAIYRWPMAWYLHPRVRPAYSEVTLLWAAYYLAKGLWQLVLVQEGSLAALTTVRIVLGWPGLAALVAITYFYVEWRLARLGGPDVEAFMAEESAGGLDAGA